MNNQNVGRALIVLFIYIFFVPSILFIAAGTIYWPMAWVYSAALIGTTVFSRGLLYFKNREQLQERLMYTNAEKTEAWDRFIVQYVGILGPVVTFLVAGLDHRFGWTTELPGWLQFLSAVLVIFGYVFAVWAMLVNQFFSSVVRIQDDRGQTVVTHGPYRVVRHPGYAGTILACIALPLMLSALWAFIPALILAVVLVVRTAFEDRLLLEQLDGYPAYAEKTRYRVFPGVW